jgi:hypothetical protein
VNHAQKVFFKVGKITKLSKGCIGRSQDYANASSGNAATLFGKALECVLASAAFTIPMNRDKLCVDA